MSAVRARIIGAEEFAASTNSPTGSLERAQSFTKVTLFWYNNPATLWFTTLMGFCFGAGETVLGLSLLALGVLELWCLEWIERAGRYLQALLTIVISTDHPSEKEIGRALEPDGCQISVPSVSYTPQGQQLRYELHWRASPSHMVDTIATRPFLRRIKYV
jgi:putative Mg2+ transporter-C (MgtC) family protein